MPRKPQRVRGLRRPRVCDSMEYKQRWIEAENKRLEADGSKWRYGFSSADPGCISLLGVEEKESPQAMGDTTEEEE